MAQRPARRALTGARRGESWRDRIDTARVEAHHSTRAALVYRIVRGHNRLFESIRWREIEDACRRIKREHDVATAAGKDLDKIAGYVGLKR